MAEMIILWWKDIPAQVIVKKSRREQFKYVLEERFEKAIDRCAMRGREIDTDSYLAGFSKSSKVSPSSHAKGDPLSSEILSISFALSKASG